MKLRIRLGEAVWYRGEDEKLRAALITDLADNEPEAWLEEGAKVSIVAFDRYGQHHHQAALSTLLEAGTFCPHDTSVSRG